MSREQPMRRKFRNHSVTIRQIFVREVCNILTLVALLRMVGQALGNTDGGSRVPVFQARQQTHTGKPVELLELLRLLCHCPHNHWLREHVT